MATEPALPAAASPIAIAQPPQDGNVVPREYGCVWTPKMGTNIVMPFALSARFSTLTEAKASCALHADDGCDGITKDNAGYETRSSISGGTSENTPYNSWLMSSCKVSGVYKKREGEDVPSFSFCFVLLFMTEYLTVKCY
jgi:hypothetical protein